MKALSILAAFKITSKTMLFHLGMFIVMWKLTPPKCEDDECSYWLNWAVV